jgi:superfamily II DNA or RNA helicase
VIAPNVEIRKRIEADFNISGPDCFWVKSGVLRDVSKGPFLAVLDGPQANISDCESSHIVVTNIQQLASRADRWLSAFPDGFFDMILVDEGHHNVAPSWQKVFEKFPDAKVLSVTATPFRSDEQPVEGQMIYRYPFTQAMQKGYIKDITAVNVAPTEIYFTYKDDERRHSLDEVLELREEDWFSKGVALAPECNAHIVDASIQWLRYLQESGTPHQIIAVACSLDHSRQVRHLYEERGVSAREIHSQMPTDEREEALRDLRSGRIEAIVQVRMLGEGFDHPPLSVAAILNPFRSLSPYIQFIGRIMRVIHQNAPGHPDNRGIVVSHVGLNIDRHWDDFRQIDSEDQDLVHGWLEASEQEPPEPSDRGQRRPLTADMIVHQEVIERFIQQPFLDPDDDTVIDNALTVLREQGLDPEALGLSRDELRRRILNARAQAAEIEPTSIPVQPQRHRQAVRARLREQTQTLAKRVLEAVDQRPGGQAVVHRTATGAANNLAAAIVLLNREINARLGIDSGQRGELTLERIETILEQLEDVADTVQAELEELFGD